MRCSYSSYRDSGVEWFGDIPDHWEVRRLGRIGSFFKGGGGTKEDETDEGVPCVRYGDLYTEHQFLITHTRARIAEDATDNYRELEHGDVLFAGSGETIEEIGKSAANLIEGHVYCGGDVIVFRPTVEVDARYLGYATDCQPSVYQKACMGRGVTVMHIYSRELKQMLIPLPPLQEQLAIAECLNRETAKIDQLVGKKRSLIERLEEYRQALITRTVTRGLPPGASRAAGLGPQPRLRPSGVEWFGDIPDHWEVIRLKYVALYRTSSVDKKTEDAESPVRLCNYTDVYYQDRIRASDGPFMRATASPKEIARFKLNRGDVLITKDSEDWRDIAVPALIDETANDFVCGYHLGLIRPTELTDSGFVFRAMQSLNVNQQLQTSATGVTRYGLPNAAVSEMLIPLPPLEEQRTIATFLDKRLERIDVLAARVETAIERLEEYRAALITAAVTGKIDVRGEVPADPEKVSA